MRTLTKFSLSILTSSFLLTGCQQFTSPLGNAPTNMVEAENQFNLQGKIGVRTPQQSGSAFFRWVQEHQEFDIELSGILGVGKTQISGKPGEVTLNSSNTGLITAETPEELLEQATGWQAPITHIISWVQARPATSSAQISKDADNRPTQFNEDGWVVDLSYNNKAKLPNKLVLKQALESDKENRITMIIQNR
jgi:outer membrane lipoprotein LolB